MSHGNHQDRLNESLSALMDGEASELELQRLLKASAGSAEVGERWSRYQLAASVLRREQVAPVDSGLAASISAAIEREEPLPIGRRWRRSGRRPGEQPLVATPVPGCRGGDRRLRRDPGCAAVAGCR
ncbi:sigma-E factor negative regulatory protein [Microbulbifer taiwanensis]|uniref:sigma-E factor negative regulatory protein n=1 Tax=Microbulbifer taiwanensis TaxID=986746 RepID=UPI003609A9A6